MRHSALHHSPGAAVAAVATVALAVAMVSTRATAQQAAPQTWLRIDTVQVKPDAWEEYRAIERDEVIPALRKAGVSSRAAWRTAEFGSTYEVVLVRPVPDFTQYDAGDSFSQTLGPREAQRLRERLRRTIARRDSAAILQRADLSVGETGRPFAVVTTLTVAPGRGADYEAFLRDTLPDVREAGVVFSVYQRVYGQPAAWILVQNLDSLSALAEPGGLFRAYGQKGADERIAGLRDIVTSVERKVFRFDPELSFSFPGADGAAP